MSAKVPSTQASNWVGIFGSVRAHIVDTKQRKACLRTASECRRYNSGCAHLLRIIVLSAGQIDSGYAGAGVVREAGFWNAAKYGASASLQPLLLEDQRLNAAVTLGVQGGTQESLLLCNLSHQLLFYGSRASLPLQDMRYPCQWLLIEPLL